MSKRMISLSTKDPITKFISLIEKYHIRDALVIDNKKLKGSVRYTTLAKKGIVDPYSAKINSIMSFPPPTASPRDNIDEVADLLFTTGISMIPVIDKNKVIGTISIYDIIDTASRTKAFRQTPVETIMSIPKTITDDTDIGKARVIMREHAASRLPVVDKNGKLAGIITVYDMLKSVRPRERISWFSMAAEMDRIMAAPVSTIMNTKPLTARKRDSLSEVSNIIMSNKTSGIVITENRMPVGIITVKDLLEFYVSGFQQKGIIYQIIGLTDEDEFLTDTVERMVRDTLQRLSEVYKPISFFVHVKKYERGGSRRKYSVRVRLRTNKGMFISKSSKWDIRDAVGEALDRLELILFKKKSTIKDRIRRSLRIRKGV